MGGRVRFAGMCLGVLGAAACTAGTTYSVAEPIRPVTTIDAGWMAILPVTSEIGSQDAAPVVAEQVEAIMAERWPSVSVVRPGEVRQRLGRAGMSATLARVFADYEATGIADADDLTLLADAAGADHLLQLRVAYEESAVLREDWFDDGVDEEDRRDVLLVARLWAAGESGPVWEATSRAGSESGTFTSLPERVEMLSEVAAELLMRMPLRGR